MQEVLLLKDLASGDVDCIFICEKGQKKEIERLISKVKEDESDDCEYDRILDLLPENVTVIPTWEMKETNYCIYY